MLCCYVTVMLHYRLLLQEPPFDPLAFAKGVTYDASEAAGSAPGCADNVRRAWTVSESSPLMRLQGFGLGFG